MKSTTVMVGAGASVVVFTTGLGTPTGSSVAPNKSIFQFNIIDIDSGGGHSWVKTIEEMGRDIFEYIINVASGDVESKADELNQDDFIFVETWGVSLRIKK